MGLGGKKWLFPGDPVISKRQIKLYIKLLNARFFENIGYLLKLINLSMLMNDVSYYLSVLHYLKVIIDQKGVRLFMCLTPLQHQHKLTN